MSIVEYGFRITAKHSSINTEAVNKITNVLAEIFKVKTASVTVITSNDEANIIIHSSAKFKKNTTWRDVTINSVIFEYPDDFGRIYFTVNGNSEGFGIFHKKIINPPQKPRVPPVNRASKNVTAHLNGMTDQQYRNLNPYLNLDGSHNKYHSPPARQQHTLTDQPNKK